MFSYFSKNDVSGSSSEGTRLAKLLSLHVKFSALKVSRGVAHVQPWKHQRLHEVLPCVHRFVLPDVEVKLII